MTEKFNEAISIAPKPSRALSQEYKDKSSRRDGNTRADCISESVFDKSGISPAFDRSPLPGEFKDRFSRVNEFHGGDTGRKWFDGWKQYGSEGQEEQLSEAVVAQRRAARQKAPRKQSRRTSSHITPALSLRQASGPGAKAEAGKASAGYDGAVLNNNKVGSKAGR